jgi:hypothetical protein
MGEGEVEQSRKQKHHSFSSAILTAVQSSIFLRRITFDGCLLAMSELQFDQL